MAAQIRANFKAASRAHDASTVYQFTSNLVFLLKATSLKTNIVSNIISSGASVLTLYNLMKKTIPEGHPKQREVKELALLLVSGELLSTGMLIGAAATGAISSPVLAGSCLTIAVLKGAARLSLKKT